MSVLTLRVPCPDEATACGIADALVNARLAACGHVRAPHESRYHWQGKIEQAQEWTVVLVTRPDLAAAVETRIAELHPYDVPSILGTLADHVNAAYADWVLAETRD